MYSSNIVIYLMLPQASMGMQDFLFHHLKNDRDGDRPARISLLRGSRGNVYFQGAWGCGCLILVRTPTVGSCVNRLIRRIGYILGIFAF